MSLSVEQGTCVGLLGPNGAGKTTTFYMVVGMIRPDAGNVYLDTPGGDETRITRTPMYRRARLGIGYLAQEASIFGAMTVEDNLREAIESEAFVYERRRLVPR